MYMLLLAYLLISVLTPCTARVPGSLSSMLCSHLEPHHPTAFPWTLRCPPELPSPALSSAHLLSPSSELLTLPELRGGEGPTAAGDSSSTPLI